MMVTAGSGVESCRDMNSVSVVSCSRQIVQVGGCSSRIVVGRRDVERVVVWMSVYVGLVEVVAV